MPHKTNCFFIFDCSDSIVYKFGNRLGIFKTLKWK